MEIIRCVKFIRCPIWLHSMLSNANRENIVSRYQTLVSSLPREAIFLHRRPKTEFITGLAGSPVNRIENSSLIRKHNLCLRIRLLYNDDIFYLGWFWGSVMKIIKGNVVQQGFCLRLCWNADHADCRLHTADRADCADFADWVYSFLLPLIMCTVHHYHMCTDVYLQGSWVGNEKITGSCLPADVKAVSRAFSSAAFTQEGTR